MDDWKVNRTTGPAYGIESDWKPNTLPKGYNPMESTAIKQVQDPELSLSAEIEPFAKGGWKKTIRASVRVFDGNESGVYIKLEALLKSGLAIAQTAISNHEHAMKEATTNE